MYDTPTMIICSLAEMEAETPSIELQGLKNIGVSARFSRSVRNKSIAFSFKHSIEKILCTTQSLVEQ